MKFEYPAATSISWKEWLALFAMLAIPVALLGVGIWLGGAGWRLVRRSNVRGVR